MRPPLKRLDGAQRRLALTKDSELSSASTAASPTSISSMFPRKQRADAVGALDQPEELGIAHPVANSGSRPRSTSGHSRPQAARLASGIEAGEDGRIFTEFVKRAAPRGGRQL